jgi:hypothetical protein
MTDLSENTQDIIKKSGKETLFPLVLDPKYGMVGLFSTSTLQ